MRTVTNEDVKRTAIELSDRLRDAAWGSSEDDGMVWFSMMELVAAMDRRDRRAES